MLIPLSHYSSDKLESDLFRESDVTLTVARLDKIHPEVSGNKLFKLHYFIEECLRSAHKTILTFGGAYSNHLAATAFICNQNGIKSIGIVRGEAAANISPTLKKCSELGMHLIFTPRAAYTEMSVGESESISEIYGPCTIIPEGGYSPMGAMGASLISDLIENENATHICTATGTATTLAGLLMKKKTCQKIISVPVIKNMHDILKRIEYLCPEYERGGIEIFSDYHFGGYAKHTNELLRFMNSFYSEHSIPTDFVYTSKMMYAITDQIKKGYFQKGSRIVCLHTGGLQGNCSLPPGKLIF